LFAAQPFSGDVALILPQEKTLPLIDFADPAPTRDFLYFDGMELPDIFL